MKKYLFLILSIVCSLTLFSQSEESIRAKEILDKTSKKTSSYSSIKVDFSFTIENLQINQSEIFLGSLVIKDDKYRMTIMDVENYFDGKTMWMYFTESNEVNISDADMLEDDMLNPSKMFTIYEEGFKMLHVGETMLNGKKVDLIDLFPENRDESYSRIKLYIYRDNLQFARIEQIGRDGTNYFIDIQKMQLNLTYPDSYFVFDSSKYPDIEVVDLR